MKEKIITIKPKGISQKQWSTLLLELNLMKKSWRSYGVDLQLAAPNLKKIISLGTTINGYPIKWKITSDDGGRILEAFCEDWDACGELREKIPDFSSQSVS